MRESAAQAIARRRREREILEAKEAHFTPSLAGGLREGLLQTDTAMRSAANTLTLGTANNASAALGALLPVRGQTYWQRYAGRLAAERARDAYDASHRALAEQVGAGGATALALLGGPAAPVLPRLAGAAKRSARETAAILGAGGISGLGIQNLTDVAAHRPSDWRDGLGALAGGVSGAAALPLGAGKAAAIGSTATSAAQSALHGRLLSAQDLGRSAAAGRVIGGVAGTAGAKLSGSLSREAKGRLGEALGTVRSAINQMEREPPPKNLFKPKGAKHGTIPDGRSLTSQLFEDKFGVKARMRPGQLLAQSLLGPNYILYHFLPQDVGKIVAAPLATVGSRLAQPAPVAPPKLGSGRR